MTGSSVVIDAGIALRLVTVNDLQARCRNLVDELVKNSLKLCAPMLWACETTSGLTKALYFQQITIDEARVGLEQLADLGVALTLPDGLQNRLAFDWTVRLKRAAAYDSYYLALAESLSCDLWTTDSRLVNAVKLGWVRLVG
jgi:predicted nucleic acid-binding protein